MVHVMAMFLKYPENRALWPLFKAINLVLKFFKNGMPLINSVLNPTAEKVCVKLSTFNLKQIKYVLLLWCTIDFHRLVNK